MTAYRSLVHGRRVYFIREFCWPLSFSLYQAPSRCSIFGTDLDLKKSAGSCDSRYCPARATTLAHEKCVSSAPPVNPLTTVENSLRRALSCIRYTKLQPFTEVYRARRANLLKSYTAGRMKIDGRTVSISEAAFCIFCLRKSSRSVAWFCSCTILDGVAGRIVMEDIDRLSMQHAKLLYTPLSQIRCREIMDRSY